MKQGSVTVSKGLYCRKGGYRTSKVRRDSFSGSSEVCDERPEMETKSVERGLMVAAGRKNDSYFQLYLGKGG